MEFIPKWDSPNRTLISYLRYPISLLHFLDIEINIMPLYERTIISFKKESVIFHKWAYLSNKV